MTLLLPGITPHVGRQVNTLSLQSMVAGMCPAFFERLDLAGDLRLGADQVRMSWSPDTSASWLQGIPSQLRTLSTSSTESSEASKGVISRLQEFVQGARVYPMPPNCPVLQWDYETRMIGTVLEFRATVAFVLDGIPHHTVGVWRPSKKGSQREAAERALGLCMQLWGELAVQENVGPLVGRVRSPRNPQPSPTSFPDCETAIQRLDELMMRQGSSPVYHQRWEGGHCQSFLELQFFEVPHTFAGKPCVTQEAADEDVAKRVLWYLQCPGFENAFAPDPDYIRLIAQDIPAPQSSWTKDGACANEDKELADRKTITMRVQNRLQKVFARQLETGASVWYWSYERDPKETSWPPLFRARAHVPLARKTFVGNWTRGQREAQMDTCLKISQFIDSEFQKVR